MDIDSINSDVSCNTCKKNIATVKISTVHDLVAAGEALDNSLFRGHGSSDWGLKSTLERDAESFSVPRDNLWERENSMLKLFEKRAHLYTKKREYPRSKFEWFALIRHYGGSSRLLDVTNSYLVGAYFALVDSQPKRDAVIWAFCEGVRQNNNAVACNSLFEENSEPGIVIASPDRLNIRLDAQNGSFFVPRSVVVSLEDQIGTEYNTDFKAKPTVYRSVDSVKTDTLHRIWKLVIPRKIHSDLFRFLSRCNVRGYSLFPGIDGLALSLREMMRAND